MFLPLWRKFIVLHQYQEVVFMILSMLILAGASGNAFVCYRLRRRRDLRKVPHYLLASLSLTGLLASLFGMPSLLIATIVNYLQAGHLAVAQTLCKVGFPLSVGCVALNALTMALMVIDRHDCVVRPFRRRLSTENVKKILLLTWFVAFITAAVLLVLLRKDTSVCYTWFPHNKPESFRTKQGNVILIYLAAIAQLDTLAIVLVIITFRLSCRFKRRYARRLFYSRQIHPFINVRRNKLHG